ncbi:NfeD family protein [Mycolicibacterium sediminis]|uniref:Membrane protein n=1 Tax=Mycolicibacterium sediminis TaxID=1286180 RepID=A0A7I7QU29_9MYCO|nr:NfeD family protein [Mycolicibacterium sediminis]BBY29745.1 membrane protein [Mycolicibacterium sediminis]
MPVWLIWLIAAIGLAGAEALTGDLFLLMLSGGALAAVASSLLVDNLVVDGVVFLVVSVLLLVMVRPVLRRRFAAGTGLPDLAKALEGKSALVLEPVGRHAGQVKLDGEVWTARPLSDDDVYQPGDQVTVVRIDGATAVVFKSV